MKNIFLLSVSLVFVSCSTGIGKKMSQETIDSIQAGKGKMTRDDVRKKIGAAPQMQMERDYYAYSGFTNYFLFSTAEKSQSYNFCYDSKTQVLTKVDGLQM